MFIIFLIVSGTKIYRIEDISTITELKIDNHNVIRWNTPGVCA